VSTEHGYPFGERNAAPFGEQTAAEAAEIISRYPQSRSALLPMLHLVQSVQGWVSPEGIAFCAEQLGLSTADVAGVVTYYTMYKRRRCGQHLLSVCTNTLCAALGGEEIYEALAGRLGSDGAPLGHEETAGTPGATGSVTLEHAECLAACDLAPVLQVNYEYFDNQTAESARELVDALRRGEKPQPSRGAPLTDFVTVERELAGFFDGDAALETTVAGNSQATETLRGTRMALDNGWCAPAMPENAPLPSVED
jgi:NADH-quinone oxidoreductase subunit E